MPRRASYTRRTRLAQRITRGAGPKTPPELFFTNSAEGQHLRSKCIFLSCHEDSARRAPQSTLQGFRWLSMAVPAFASTPQDETNWNASIQCMVSHFPQTPDAASLTFAELCRRLPRNWPIGRAVCCLRNVERKWAKATVIWSLLRGTRWYATPRWPLPSF